MKNGTVSNMVTIRDTISLAIAPLFASIATVTSGVNNRYSKYAQDVIDLLQTDEREVKQH